jgi:hypothetical protein
VSVIRKTITAKHGNPLLKQIIGHGLELFDVVLISEIFSPVSAFHHQTPKEKDIVTPVAPCLIGNTVHCQQGGLVNEIATMGVRQGLILYVLPVVLSLAKANLPVGMAVNSL